MTPLTVWAERVLVSGLSPIFIFGSRFAANIILSHLLAPDEFGVAIAINVVLTVGWLSTDVALDRFVMIDGSLRALATAHMLAAINSVSLALALVIVAPLLANLFGVPGFVDSFRLAAAISAITGVAHFGIKQIQRNYNYGPETIAQVLANIAALAGLYSVATTFHDHRAIVASLAVQFLVYVIMSHLLAYTPYRLGGDKETLRRALSFGLPLTLNGVGLAIMSQLDRVLVGYWFGVRDLATYAVIISMSVIPTNLLCRIFSGPSFSFILSGGPDNERVNRYRILFGFYSILTGVYACWMAVTLDVLTPLLFGQDFTIDPAEHVLLVSIACLRIQRSGAPTTLLLASGRTKQLALLNLSSGFGLVIALVCLTVWPRLESMLIGLGAGELVSFALLFAYLGEDAMRVGRRLIDLASAVAVPIVVVSSLASRPEATWEARSMLIALGAIAVAAQTSFELLTNDKFRQVVLGLLSSVGLHTSVRRWMSKWSI